jgi:hypothetical protein
MKKQATKMTKQERKAQLDWIDDSDDEVKHALDRLALIRAERPRGTLTCASDFNKLRAQFDGPAVPKRRSSTCLAALARIEAYVRTLEDLVRMQEEDASATRPFA